MSTTPVKTKSRSATSHAPPTSHHIRGNMSASQLFNVNSGPRNPRKRLIKQVNRFNPNETQPKSPPPPTGHGFACPKCESACAYDDKKCEGCGATVMWQSGVGAMLCTERNSTTSSPNSSSSKRKSNANHSQRKCKKKKSTRYSEEKLEDSLTKIDVLEEKNQRLSICLREKEEMVLEKEKEKKKALANQEEQFSAKLREHDKILLESAKELEESMTKMNELEEKNRHLSTSLTKQEAMVGEKEKEKEEVLGKISRMREEGVAASDSIAKLRNEKQGYAAQLKDRNRLVEENNSKIAELTKKNVQQSEELSQQSNMYEKGKRENSDLKHHNGNLRQENGNLRHENGNLRHENGDLRQHLQQLQRENNTLQSDCDYLHREKESLEKECQYLEDEADGKGDELNRVRSSLSRVERELTEHLEKYLALQTETQETTQELLDATQRNTRLHQENTGLQTTILRLSGRMTELKTKVEEGKQVRKELEQAHAEVVTLKAAQSQLVENMTATKNQHVKELAEQRRISSVLGKKVDVLLRVQSENHGNECSETRNKFFQGAGATIKELRKRITALEKENEELRKIANDVPQEFMDFLAAQNLDMDIFKKWKEPRSDAVQGDAAHSENNGGRPIENKGNQCHLICVIHCLANSPSLAIPFLKEDFDPKKNRCPRDNEVDAMLESRFCQAMSRLQHVIASVGITDDPNRCTAHFQIGDLMADMGITKDDGQEDANETLEKIFQAIEEHLKKFGRENWVERALRIVFSPKLLCSQCEDIITESENETFYTWYLGLRNDKCVQGLVKKYLVGEETKSSTFCTCGHNGRLWTKSVDHLPETLIIQLSRADYVDGKFVKFTKPIGISPELHVGREKYRLRFGTFHQGKEAVTGHYNCLVKDPLVTDPENKLLWHLFDDKNCRKQKLYGKSTAATLLVYEKVGEGMDNTSSTCKLLKDLRAQVLGRETQPTKGVGSGEEEEEVSYVVTDYTDRYRHN